MAVSQAKFLVRQHSQTLTYELLEQRKKIGPCPTGILYEQKMQLTNKAGSRRKLEQAGGKIIAEHVERCRSCQSRLN